jgi:hypothetical protein
MYCGVRWSATTDPRRRPGWWRTAPATLGITALALPLTVPMAGVALGLAAYELAELVVSGRRDTGTFKT